MALIEGWWKKKAKKHNLKKDKPRYYILVTDHLDWYNKPVCYFASDEFLFFLSLTI
jgi:hypothetical protein